LADQPDLYRLAVVIRKMAKVITHRQFMAARRTLRQELRRLKRRKTITSYAERLRGVFHVYVANMADTERLKDYLGTFDLVTRVERDMYKLIVVLRDRHLQALESILTYHQKYGAVKKILCVPYMLAYTVITPRPSTIEKALRGWQIPAQTHLLKNGIMIRLQR